VPLKPEQYAITGKNFMNTRELVLAFCLSVGFLGGGLLQSQSSPESKAGHLVEVGKSYVAFMGGTYAPEFKVVEVVNDCWVKVEGTRKTAGYTRLNLCQALVMKEASE
jgi:hypothetical protein